MTKTQMNRVKNAARELLRLKDTGADVDAMALEWATWILRPLGRARFRPSPNQNAIVDLLGANDAPRDGYMVATIAEMLKMDRKITGSTLFYLVKMGRIFKLEMSRRSRYFVSQAALEAGRPVAVAVDQHHQDVNRVVRPVTLRTGPTQAELADRRRAAKQAIRAEKLKAKEERAAERIARRAERDAQREQAAARAQSAADLRVRKAEQKHGAKPKHVPKPKAHQALTVKQQPNVIIAPPPTRDIRHSVFIPEDFPITKVPSGRDTRYDPDPNSDGAGFLSDWKRLRGEA